MPEYVRTLRYDYIHLPLIHRDQRLVKRGSLQKDERFVRRACVRGRRAYVFEPAVEVDAEREPERLDVSLQGDVDELLRLLLIGVQEPADEAEPDGERLVPEVRKAGPGERQVFPQRVGRGECCDRARW